MGNSKSSEASHTREEQHIVSPAAHAAAFADDGEQPSVSHSNGTHDHLSNGGLQIPASGLNGHKSPYLKLQGDRISSHSSVSLSVNGDLSNPVEPTCSTGSLRFSNQRCSNRASFTRRRMSVRDGRYTSLGVVPTVKLQPPSLLARSIPASKGTVRIAPVDRVVSPVIISRVTTPQRLVRSTSEVLAALSQRKRQRDDFVPSSNGTCPDMDCDVGGDSKRRKLPDSNTTPLTNHTSSHRDFLPEDAAPEQVARDSPLPRRRNDGYLRTALDSSFSSSLRKRNISGSSEEPLRKKSSRRSSVQSLEAAGAPSMGGNVSAMSGKNEQHSATPSLCDGADNESIESDSKISVAPLLASARSSRCTTPSQLRERMTPSSRTPRIRFPNSMLDQVGYSSPFIPTPADVAIDEDVQRNRLLRMLGQEETISTRRTTLFLTSQVVMPIQKPQVILPTDQKDDMSSSVLTKECRPPSFPVEAPQVSLSSIISKEKTVSADSSQSAPVRQPSPVNQVPPVTQSLLVTQAPAATQQSSKEEYSASVQSTATSQPSSSLPSFSLGDRMVSHIAVGLSQNQAVGNKEVSSPEISISSPVRLPGFGSVSQPSNFSVGSSSSKSHSDPPNYTDPTSTVSLQAITESTSNQLPFTSAFGSNQSTVGNSTAGVPTASSEGLPSLTTTSTSSMGSGFNFGGSVSASGVGSASGFSFGGSAIQLGAGNSRAGTTSDQQNLSKGSTPTASAAFNFGTTAVSTASNIGLTSLAPTFSVPIFGQATASTKSSPTTAASSSQPFSFGTPSISSGVISTIPAESTPSFASGGGFTFGSSKPVALTGSAQTVSGVGFTGSGSQQPSNSTSTGITPQQPAVSSQAPAQATGAFVFGQQGTRLSESNSTKQSFTFGQASSETAAPPTSGSAPSFTFGLSSTSNLASATSASSNSGTVTAFGSSLFSGVGSALVSVPTSITTAPNSFGLINAVTSTTSPSSFLFGASNSTGTSNPPHPGSQVNATAPLGGLASSGLNTLAAPTSSFSFGTVAGNSASDAKGFGVSSFGQVQPAPSNSFQFGASSTKNTVFGAQSNSNANLPSMFGTSSSGPTLFGSLTNNVSPFGAPVSSAASSGSLFGSTANNANVTLGSSAPAFSFGVPASSVTSTSGSSAPAFSFGTPAGSTTSASGSGIPGFSFGAPASSSAVAFGSTVPSFTFRVAVSNAPSTSGSGTSGFSFGTPASSSAVAFGGSAPSFSFGTSSVANVANSSGVFGNGPVNAPTSSVFGTQNLNQNSNSAGMSTGFIANTNGSVFDAAKSAAKPLGFNFSAQSVSPSFSFGAGTAPQFGASVPAAGSLFSIGSASARQPAVTARRRRK